MATVKEMFSNCVQDGIKAAKSIAEPNQKAMAYAEIAKALAMTGLVGGTNIESISEESEPETGADKGKESLKAPVPKTKKKEDKKEDKKETAKKEKAVVESKEEATPSEPELSEEWTDEMVELKSEQIAKMNQFKEEFGEEPVEQCVSMFSEGQYESLADITPLNIDAFVAFMESLAEQDN